MGLLREMPGTPVALVPATIPACLHSQQLWGFLFPILETWAGGSGCGIGTPGSSGGTFADEIFFLILTTTHGYGTSLFGVLASLTSLNVASP